MKACLNCGAEAPDDAATCPACGRAFASVRAQTYVAPPPTRPTGGWQSVTGGLAAMIGALMLAISLVPGSNQDTTTVVFGPVGEALIAVGLFLWALGQVLRAIWWLPGRAE